MLGGFLRLTFRELWAKKITVGLFLVATLVWLMLSFALNLDVVEGSLAGVRLFGQEATMNDQVRDAETDEVVAHPLTLQTIVVQVESFVAGAAYWVGILLALFATAPLLPGLFERGRIDLLLSKPLSRTKLLAGHVLGVWLVMLMLALYLLGAVWLVMSLKSGIWHFQFFWAILVVVAMFAVMYGVVVLVAVLSESTALALIVAYGLIFVSLILAAKEQLAPQITLPWRHVYLVFYHVLPKFAGVTPTVTQLSAGEAVAAWYPLASSLVFGAVFYGLAALRFSRRDF